MSLREFKVTVGDVQDPFRPWRSIKVGVNTVPGESNTELNLRVRRVVHARLKGAEMIMHMTRAKL